MTRSSADTADPDRLTADISEIFSSVQGEGPFMGVKQIFVKFAACNLRCKFCDQKKAFGPKHFTVDKMLSIVKQINENSGGHHSVSLTGGEPLLYAEFLKVFLKMLKDEGMKSYLETNGTLPEELARVIGLVDIIAMDVKLPSSTIQKAFWHEHAEFLKIASAKKVFVKVVITADTTKEDVEMALSLVKKVKGRVPLVLQPASPVSRSDKPVEHERLMKFLEMGLKQDLESIRVIPQAHKILGVK
jgi:organic radical activating enzyme